MYNITLSKKDNTCKQAFKMLIWNLHFFFTEFHELVSIAVDSLKLGNIIALPTDTIYGIAGLVQNSEAVNRLYSIKNRDCKKPIAISVADISDVYK